MAAVDTGQPREKTVAATEFQRNFTRFRDEATSGEIVKVSSHGRIVGAYISAAELEHFLELKRRERELFVAGEIPDDLVEDIKNAKYGA